MHVEIGYRKICHLVNCIQLVKMHLSSNLRTGLINDNKNCKELMLNPPADFLSQFGGLLEKTWQTKKNLEETISSKEMDDMHAQVKSLGGYGGKLSGAGGGGFFYEIVPKENHAALMNIYGKNRFLKVAYEPLGSRIMSEMY